MSRRVPSARGDNLSGPDAAGYWVPDEPAPPAGWPAAPDVVPCVAGEWRLADDGQGGVRARPVHTWLTHPLAVVKDDGGVARARRFARAWAELRPSRLAGSAAETPPVDGTGIGRWATAGVLRRLRPPGRRPQPGAAGPTSPCDPRVGTPPA